MSFLSNSIHKYVMRVSKDGLILPFEALSQGIWDTSPQHCIQAVLTGRFFHRYRAIQVIYFILRASTVAQW